MSIYCTAFVSFVFVFLMSRMIPKVHCFFCVHATCGYVSVLMFRMKSLLDTNENKDKTWQMVTERRKHKHDLNFKGCQVKMGWMISKITPRASSRQCFFPAIVIAPNLHRCPAESSRAERWLRNPATFTLWHAKMRERGIQRYGKVHGLHFRNRSFHFNKP